MPYLKGNHAEALRIHNEYQMVNDQKSFLKAARDFLLRENAAANANGNGRNNGIGGGHVLQPDPGQGSLNSATVGAPQSAMNMQQRTMQNGGGNLQHQMNPQYQSPGPNLQPQSHLPQQLPTQSSYQPAIQAPSANSPIPQHSFDSSPKPLPPQSLFPQNNNSAPTAMLPPAASNQHPGMPNAGRLPLSQQQQQQQQLHQQRFLQSQYPPNYPQSGQMPLMPPVNPQQQQDAFRMNSIERGLDALMAEDQPLAQQQQQQQPNGSMWRSPNNAPQVGSMTPLQQQHPQRMAPGPAVPTPSKPMPITPPRNNREQSKGQSSTPDRGTMSPWGYGTPVEQSSILASRPPNAIGQPPKSSGKMNAPETPANSKKESSAVETPKPPVKKEAPPPKRLWTHPEEQPGKVSVKGHNGDDSSIVIPLAPREELHAQWAISLAYLRKYAAEKYGANSSLETVLSKMTLGLFRRGCTENGMQASIVSKSVLGDYWKDPATETVRGKVPFYSPRTPGHVVFRLFWEDEPLHTLATGPAVLVRVTEGDFDNSVRFILGNFKGKKSNPTSLSSLHSLATILETQITRGNDSAARATWGCIQEARKVLEACAQEHERTSSKLASLEETVDELKKQVEEEGGDDDDAAASTDTGSGDDELSEAALELKEKVRILMSGRASCERKWRDSQLAFAGILRAVVTNPTMTILLRRELIAKMRVEYELWCPLSEEFALAKENARLWFEPLRDLPQNIPPEVYQSCSQARVKMQLRTLGFTPNVGPLDDVLFPKNPNTPGERSMDPGAVAVFNKMSSAMGKLYQELFRDEELVVRRRELIRKATEECVQESNAFPPGTRVVIFGSSANGFGSPKSDLDMCLQLPEGRKMDDEDINGPEAMAKLANFLDESGGMEDVDSARLSARIPIIMYRCRDPFFAGEGEAELFECDLSMHNPLAVLNTSLLRTYAEITPITRVLSSIIKRWAKARDINNPARHTLSSYGYILMLLHFLTYHKRTGNGLVSPVAPPGGDNSHRHQGTPRPNPILPNLQWIDPSWLGQQRGTPYREIFSLPRNLVKHPMEESKRVNTHFYRPSTPNEGAMLQMHFAGQDLSLAILLASFFRYYAYEFDYKRYVVSLHSTSARGLMEREVKAELDGWRNYSAALTIEDPFETFYDVAHVLRGGYYHRIRREFAVAYSKIADAASGRQGAWNKGDLRNMTGEELIEWLCEPIEKDKEEDP